MVGFYKSKHHFNMHCKARRLALQGMLAVGLGLGGGGSAMATQKVSITSKAQKAQKAPTVLVLGDSLSAEYGIAAGSGWVALLGKRLADKKIPARIVNSSISGETTSGGVSRLPALLQLHRPNVLIIELGANDALRGLALSATQANLTTMVNFGQQSGCKVLLVGMQMPPNYGKRYSADFAALFKLVAQQRRTALVPFLLEGVANRPDARDWFQSDGLHPLAKGHPVMLDNIWPALKPLL
jgi:acyl-CoA thioesterase I